MQRHAVVLLVLTALVSGCARNAYPDATPQNEAACKSPPGRWNWSVGLAGRADSNAEWNECMERQLAANEARGAANPCSRIKPGRRQDDCNAARSAP
jgi:hypothetical protein